jgi:hypothetical protein
VQLQKVRTSSIELDKGFLRFVEIRDSWVSVLFGLQYSVGHFAISSGWQNGKTIGKTWQNDGKMTFL